MHTLHLWAACSGLAVLAHAAAQTPANLLKNGDFGGAWQPNSSAFETGTAEGEVPDGWSDVSTWSGASTRFSRVAGPAGLPAALRLEMTKADGPASVLQLRSAFAVVLEGGAAYRVALHLRAPAAGGDTLDGRPGAFLDRAEAAAIPVELAIRQHEPPRTVFWSQVADAAGAWRHFEFDFLTPAGGEARFFVALRAPGTVEVAGLSLVSAPPDAAVRAATPVSIETARCVPTRHGFLRHGDICSQYSDTPENLAKYLIDVVTWGNGVRVDPEAAAGERARIAAARAAGVRVHAINCTLVQEGGRYVLSGGERLPDTYQRYTDLRRDYEGTLARLAGLGIDLKRHAVLDLHGDWNPVPWLRRRYRIPMASIHYPEVRQWYCEMADAAGDSGANALHFDEPAMSAYGLMNPDPGGFSEASLTAFRDWLKTRPEAAWRAAGMTSLEGYDFAAQVRAAGGSPRQSPLWRDFVRFQLFTARDFVAYLRDRVRSRAGSDMPFSANADPGTWLKLPFIDLMDFMSSEVGQQCTTFKPPWTPVLTYKLGDALGQPVVAMAHGSEWYEIGRDQRPVLVGTWIALAYALGHHFIIPHRAWIMDPVKGSQTYKPDADHYACMARFIKAVGPLLDDHQPLSTVAVVLAADAIERDRSGLNVLAKGLCDAHIPFHLVVEGNDLLPRQVTGADLDGAAAVLVAAPYLLSGEAYQRVGDLAAGRPVVRHSGGALPGLLPRPIRVQGADGVWVLPRLVPGNDEAAVTVHLLNRDYDDQTRAMIPKGPFTVALDGRLLRGRRFSRATVHQPRLHAALPANAADCVATAAVGVAQRDGWVELTIPALDLWAVVELR